MDDWLTHPLFLLIVSAVISSFLVPALTRSWQDHQKGLEIKTSLVSEIAEAVTRFMMAVQFAELRAAGQSPEDFAAAYRDWEVKSAVIASKLRAYFPDTVIDVEWQGYTTLAARFYALARATEKEKGLRLEELEKAILLVRARSKSKIDLERARIATLASASEWDLYLVETMLSAVPSDSGLSEFERRWIQAKNDLLAQRDVLVHRILAARISLRTRGLLGLHKRFDDQRLMRSVQRAARRENTQGPPSAPG